MAVSVTVCAELEEADRRNAKAPAAIEANRVITGLLVKSLCKSTLPSDYAADSKSENRNLSTFSNKHSL
jgi:hypothetical protein